MLRRVVWLEFTHVSEMFAASIIALIMEAASTSEKSVNFYQTTRRNIPEDSHLRSAISEVVKLPTFRRNLLPYLQD
jgi:hypothetical protein